MSKGHLILVRGLPGSGKSTFARTIAEAGYKHLETDMWFLDYTTGEYVFRPEYLKQAHEWCQAETYTRLQIGENVVVSNTFVKRWELQPYLEMEAASVAVVEMSTMYDNVHGVPPEVVERMRRQWEPLGPLCAKERKVAL